MDVKVSDLQLGWQSREMKISSSGWLVVNFSGEWIPVFQLSTEQQLLWNKMSKLD
jgi:hypothetical protein